MEVQWQLLTLWDIQRYAQDGFFKVSQLSTDVKRKPSVLNCWEHFDAEREAFLSWIVTGDKTWAHHYKSDEKAVNGVALL